MVYVISTVTKTGDVIKVDTLLCNEKLNAHMKLLDTLETILKTYGICSNSNSIKDGIIFKYDNNTLIHIDFKELEISNPKVLLSLKNKLIKNILINN